MTHESNEWIASHWQGKTVKQTDGFPALIGRTGIVKETMWDEKGALHCLMSPTPYRIELAVKHCSINSVHDWWCPASMLTILT